MKIFNMCFVGDLKRGQFKIFLFYSIKWSGTQVYCFTYLKVYPLSFLFTPLGTRLPETVTVTRTQLLPVCAPPLDEKHLFESLNIIWLLVRHKPNFYIFKDIQIVFPKMFVKFTLYSSIVILI